MGCCTTTIDRHWLKSARRKHTDDFSLLKNFTMINTSKKLTLKLLKDNKDEDYIPQIKIEKYDMFSKYVGGNGESIPEKF